MDCRFIKRNFDLDRLFYETFRKFPYLLRSERWILFNCKTFYTSQREYILYSIPSHQIKSKRKHHTVR